MQTETVGTKKGAPTLTEGLSVRQRTCLEMPIQELGWQAWSASKMELQWFNHTPDTKQREPTCCVPLPGGATMNPPACPRCIIASTSHCLPCTTVIVGACMQTWHCCTKENLNQDYHQRTLLRLFYKSQCSINRYSIYNLIRDVYSRIQNFYL